jgi:hypothetical protein
MPRRVVAILGLTALVAGMCVAVLDSAPAHAALYSPIPADASGDPQDQFTDQQSVWAYVLSDIAGGRICIVHDGVGFGSCDAPAMGKAGPMYNTTSCENCHINNGPGAPLTAAMDAKSSMVFKLYNAGDLGNQLQLWLASVAYVLVNELRRTGLANTELARAQAGTIRTRLLKVAARITLSVRRVVVSLSGVHPLKVFAQALGNIQRAYPLTG